MQTGNTSRVGSGYPAWMTIIPFSNPARVEPPVISFTPDEMTRADIPAVQLFLVEYLNLFFNAGRTKPSADENIVNPEQQYILQKRNLLVCAWNKREYGKNISASQPRS
ncbi:hypothetical protein [Citrobacter amalonaticus]|uniref:hypothetical protein n=1 Tax=Citrobacter amalonaticus TaxID=35703 RepID=UPI0015E1AB97|nr:hypothetical protein [Citrobacter amalonaticus]